MRKKKVDEECVHNSDAFTHTPHTHKAGNRHCHCHCHYFIILLLLLLLLILKKIYNTILLLIILKNDININIINCHSL